MGPLAAWSEGRNLVKLQLLLSLALAAPVLLLSGCGTPKVEPAAPTKVAVAPKPPPPPVAVPKPRADGPLTEAESDIARTFDGAYVVMPGTNGGASLATRMESSELRDYLARSKAKKYPTILYLHGCAGLSGLTPLRAMARRGFAVVAPDSFRRRFRPPQCDPKQKRGGRNAYVFDFRAVEISYALHRFRRLAWVDRRRLFLVGVSEGGLAAAQFRGAEFRARVITEWTCHGNTYQTGLAAPADEPVLAVVQANDPWYRGKRRRGDCGAFFGRRPRSRSLVLRGGERHDVWRDSLGIQTILDFLSEEARRSLYQGS